MDRRSLDHTSPLLLALVGGLAAAGCSTQSHASEVPDTGDAIPLDAGDAATGETDGDAGLGDAPADARLDAGPTACLRNDCHANEECGSCADGHTICDPAAHRCVACDTSTPCTSGSGCTSFGECARAGLTCPKDANGLPTVTCATDRDCAACDPLHLVCDVTTRSCVACTSSLVGACQTNERCVADGCVPECPSKCAKDDDCSACGSTGSPAHACHAGTCAQCSTTSPCPAGSACNANGVCVASCGLDAVGGCTTGGDCARCASSAQQCNAPTSGAGVCGPKAASCADVAAGAPVLPAPWDRSPNACSHDGDCAGVGVPFNVGAMLRELTGQSAIGDATIAYPISVCAAVTVGSGASNQACGVCVPCRQDADCLPIGVDSLPGLPFGPAGSLQAAVLLDQMFGAREHAIHMYCRSVSAGYGVCAPCPGLVNVCGAP